MLKGLTALKIAGKFNQYASDFNKLSRINNVIDGKVNVVGPEDERDWVFKFFKREGESLYAKAKKRSEQKKLRKDFRAMRSIEFTINEEALSCELNKVDHERRKAAKLMEAERKRKAKRKSRSTSKRT